MLRAFPPVVLRAFRSEDAGLVQPAAGDAQDLPERDRPGERRAGRCPGLYRKAA